MTGPRPWRYIAAAYPRSTIMHSSSSNLSDWSKEHLIAYVHKLEAANQKLVRSKNLSRPQPPHIHPHANRMRNQKPFDFSKHPQRKIALKFFYDGSHYSGLAAQADPTPFPTVEEVLWGALTLTKLVDPQSGFRAIGWDKCGRTDAGVSSAGQVVSFWVRSALKTEHQQEQIAGPSSSEPIPEPPQPQLEAPFDAAGTEGDAQTLDGLAGEFGALCEWDEPPSNTNIRPSATPNVRRSDEQELKYVGTLNSALPPSIRVLAWSPVADDFSARFACKSRHYKYFFTSHGLDIEAMRDGAARLVGEHDFRNLCKIDPSKQIASFKRNILRADISPVTCLTTADDGHGAGQVYVFDLIGTAFLYNQVRHIMAILFLIGTRLEKPWLLTALLNVDAAHPYPPFRAGEPVPPVVSTKPIYQMADAHPLVLWDCMYADGDVQWRIDGERVGADGVGAMKLLASNLYAQQRTTCERSLIGATLDQYFLLATSRYHDPRPEHLPVPPDATIDKAMFGIPLGGGKERRGAKYTAVLERERLEPVEILNERWRANKGARIAEQEAEAMDGIVDE